MHHHHGDQQGFDVLHSAVLNVRQASSHGEIGRICHQGINAEFSQFDTERTVQRIRETKILFFETINKVDLCLAKLTER